MHLGRVGGTQDLFKSFPGDLETKLRDLSVEYEKIWTNLWKICVNVVKYVVKNYIFVVTSFCISRM